MVPIWVVKTSCVGWFSWHWFGEVSLPQLRYQDAADATAVEVVTLTILRRRPTGEWPVSEYLLVVSTEVDDPKIGLTGSAVVKMTEFDP